MSILINAVIRIIIAFFLFFYAMFYFQSSRKGSPGSACAYSFFFIGCWQFLDGMQCLIRIPYAILIIQNFIYLMANASTFSLYLIATRVSVPSNRAKDKYAKILVYSPIIFSVISISVLIFTNKSIFVTLPEEVNFAYMLPGYQFPKKPAYYIHSIYSYGMIGASIIIFIMRAIRTFSHLKKVYFTLLVGILIYLIPSLIKFITENFFLEQYSNFTDLISISSFFIACTIFFFAIFFLDSERTSRIFTDKVFSSSDSPIFTFNSHKEYLNTNEQGIKFLEKYKINPNIYAPFSEIFSEDKFQRLEISSSNPLSKKYYLTDVNDKSIYYCNEFELQAATGEVVGFYITLTQMELFNSMIQKLEYEAYTDELTNCKRRTAFPQIIVKKYGAQREPFILVCASIKNLYECNETLGFAKTDSYVKTFANILTSCVGFTEEFAKLEIDVFRMGGSDFAFAIPLKYEDQIPDLFRTIKSECIRFSRTKTMALTCGLGYSVLNNCSNIMKGWEKSYENMLFDKN